MLQGLIQVALCDDHAGNVHPPRCTACDALQIRAAAVTVEARLSGECALHPGYPSSTRWPCERCVRDAEGAL